MSLEIKLEARDGKVLANSRDVAAFCLYISTAWRLTWCIPPAVRQQITFPPLHPPLSNDSRIDIQKGISWSCSVISVVSCLVM
jgi:hypothetical protein